MLKVFFLLFMSGGVPVAIAMAGAALLILDTPTHPNANPASWLNSCRTVASLSLARRAISRTCSSRASGPKSRRKTSALTREDSSRVRLSISHGYTTQMRG